MAEQRMKVRDKKVQKMTKDGLVEENLTDKSSVRVSNRAKMCIRDRNWTLTLPQSVFSKPIRRNCPLIQKN